MDNEKGKTLTCPMCHGQKFKKDKVVLPKYGIFRISDYKVDIFVCESCNYIVFFENGSTMFLGVD